MRHSSSRPIFRGGLAVVAATAAMLLVPVPQASAKAVPGCAAGGVKVDAGASPATVSVTDTTTGTVRQVVVTITGTTFTITPAASSVTLQSASWCLKASTETRTGTGTSGTSTITNKKGVAQKVGHLVLYSVATPADPFATARAACEGGPAAARFDARVAELPSEPFITVWNCVAAEQFEFSGDQWDALRSACEALGESYGFTALAPDIVRCRS